MASAHVIRPGLQTTVQDRGRWGLQSRGVPVGGPMDPVSHRLANILAGNDREAAVLEVTLVGPELEFDDERIVAVTGAEFRVAIDGRVQAMHRPVTVPAGSRLTFGPCARGARAYIAVSGGIAVPPVLGSRSTHLVARLGGMNGRALVAGDRLPLGTSAGRPRTVPEPFAATLPRRGAETLLRVLAGPHDDRFEPGALEALQGDAYTVRTESDRMGFRLEGPMLQHRGSADMISDVTPFGVLQVPASKQPLLLMADRQTTGGYPNLATIISADIALAGQLAPGDRVRFEVCTRKAALAALIAQEQTLMAAEGSGR